MDSASPLLPELLHVPNIAKVGDDPTLAQLFSGLGKLTGDDACDLMGALYAADFRIPLADGSEYRLVGAAMLRGVISATFRRERSK